MDVVDQSVDLCVIGQTHVKEFTVNSKGTFLCLCPDRENHVKVLQNLINADIYVCIDTADSDRPADAREPAGHCDRKLPRLALQ